ncbi:MAG: alpha-amylase family protein [Bacteroidota bacterium]
MNMKIEISIIAITIILSSMQSPAQYKRPFNEPMPSRQVHLDFHTSEFIPGIGEKFDKKQFQEALKTGHLNQINVFAKCHHSWSYYPTKIGKQHPNLKFDLLGAQIEACHEMGVKCPIYFTVGWSAHDAETHPEWCARKKDGKYLAFLYDFDAKPTDVKTENSWKWLCPAAGGTYSEMIKKQVEEICQNYPVDGFWFDIYHVADLGCYCENCIKRMQAEGVDPNNHEAVVNSTSLAIKKHQTELRAVIAKYFPTATVYFNATPHVRNNGSFNNQLYDLNTHQELEDLPTTWGGYDKLPLEAKYHLQNGSPIIAMSGKFHKSWGEFGGFKHADAIKYEAAAMISNGAACNFGDQLHPSGVMDMETYRNIGKAYEYVEKIEKYGLGGLPVSSLGLWLSLDNEADYGLVNILLETHNDFIIANEKNLDKLELMIVPSAAHLSVAQAQQINSWVQKGGKLIAFGNGALNEARDKFLLNIGADYIGESPFNFDFTVVNKELGADVVSTPFLNYESALRCKPTSGTVLAHIREPYFNRTMEKYSGHRATPYQLENSEYPSIVRNGNVIYFAHALDQLYYTSAVRLHRQLVANAIDLLYEKPMLAVKGLPSCGRISLLKQENENRYVAHLLYAPALQRGEVMVIEDFLPVQGVELEVIVPEKVKKVYQVPDGQKLRFTRTDNKLIVQVPAFTMHTGIVFGY